MVAPGWYGKLPALGDFASRRLPQPFIRSVDDWLQASINASRQTLGTQWLDIYLTSPLWRFALLPGAIAHSSEAWAGVMMPSVDRVGRYFPFVIATAVTPRPDLLSTIFAASAWFTNMEELALQALADGANVDSLDASIAAMPLEATLDANADRQGAALGNWWTDARGAACSLRVDDASSLGSIVAGGAELAGRRTRVGTTLWWTLLPDSPGAQLHGFLGLPPANSFATFLTQRGDGA